MSTNFRFCKPTVCHFTLGHIELFRFVVRGVQWTMRGLAGIELPAELERCLWPSISVLGHTMMSTT
jgi:hypothetical protein